MVLEHVKRSACANQNRFVLVGYFGTVNFALRARLNRLKFTALVIYFFNNLISCWLESYHAAPFFWHLFE